MESNPRRILIVDDSPMFRNLHARILTGAGYQCAQAQDGSDGLEELYRSQYDLVLVDINMPHMDGLSFIRTVREESGFDAIPILIVSTEDMEGDRAEGFRAGASGYLVKPADPAELVASVRMALGG